MKSEAAYLGIMISLALILSYVESLIPVNFGVPGMKLGLANLMIVIMLYTGGWKKAFLLSVARIILSGLIFGNLFAILYSLAGGMLSLCVMTLLKKQGGFSVIGISAAGGVFHNIGQLVIAMAAVQTFQISYYLPVLILSGLCTGVLIGIISKETMTRISRISGL